MELQICSCFTDTQDLYIVSTSCFSGIFPDQNATCYIGERCTILGLKGQHLSVSEGVALLHGGCGTQGTAWSGVPEGGLMHTDTVESSNISVSLPEILPGSRLFCVLSLLFFPLL